MNDQSTGARVVIAAALIGAVAVIIAAIINILPSILDDGNGAKVASPSVVQSVTPGPQSDGPSPSLTAEPSASASPTATATLQPLTFLERVAGEWTLQSWTEQGGPVTLGIQVLNGTMSINESDGQAAWRMDIQESGEPTTPQPGIRCGGQATLSAMIEGIPGGDKNGSIDWTADLRSIGHSSTGEGFIWLPMCGWATIGTRHPFDIGLEGAPTQSASRIEMSNEDGTFRWSR